MRELSHLFNFTNLQFSSGQVTWTWKGERPFFFGSVLWLASLYIETPYKWGLVGLLFSGQSTLFINFFWDLWKVCKLYNFTHTKKSTPPLNEVWLWNLNGTASNLSIRIYLLKSGTLLFRRLALFSRVLTLRVINPATILLFKSTVNC